MPMGLLNMHGMSKYGFSLYMFVASAVFCVDNVTVFADVASVFGFMLIVIGLLLKWDIVQYDCLWGIWSLIVTNISFSIAEKFRFSAEFIEMRRQALDMFVNRVASHHDLQQSEDLRTFLQADEEVMFLSLMLWVVRFCPSLCDELVNNCAIFLTMCWRWLDWLHLHA
jgi:hypothetical protein